MNQLIYLPAVRATSATWRRNTKCSIELRTFAASLLQCAPSGHILCNVCWCTLCMYVHGYVLNVTCCMCTVQLHCACSSEIRPAVVPAEPSTLALHSYGQSKTPTTEENSFLCVRLRFGKNATDVCLCSVHGQRAQWLTTGISGSSSHALPGQHGLQRGSVGWPRLRCV